MKYKLTFFLTIITLLIKAQNITTIHDTLNVKLYLDKSIYPVLDTLMSVKGMFKDHVSNSKPWKIYFDQNHTKLAYENYLNGDTLITNQYWRSNGNPKSKEKALKSEWEHPSYFCFYSETYCENGQLINKGFVQNMKEPQHMVNYYCNGNKRNRFIYVDGIFDGLYETWYENGQKESEGKFDQMKLQGEWKYWDKNGKLYLIEVYKDGVLIESKKQL